MKCNSGGQGTLHSSGVRQPSRAETASEAVTSRQGLLELPVLYLSRAIVRKKADYSRLLLAVTTRDGWEDWILYMLRAVDDGAHPRHSTADAGDRRLCAGGSVRGVQQGAGRADLRPALLPHQERRRSGNRSAADSGWVAQATGRRRGSAGGQGGPREAVHRSAPDAAPYGGGAGRPLVPAAGASAQTTGFRTMSEEKDGVPSAVEPERHLPREYCPVVTADRTASRTGAR